MLTYQLQTRVLRVEGDATPQFPNDVTLELKLGPPTAFGAKTGPSRALVKSHKAVVKFNSNTGRWFAQSDPPLAALQVLIKSPTSLFSLQGDVLCYQFSCEDRDQLEGTLMALRWILPTLLNLEFADPPTVLWARGKVGDTSFRWEIAPQEWHASPRIVDSDTLEQHVAYSFESLPIFNGLENRRLAAALHYFYVAVRLNVCGDSPWEFMAESILNYSKTLEILFVTSDKSTDDVRRELAKLGYSETEIEGDFVPLLILRRSVDVAHPRVALFKRRDLETLYHYVAQTEECLRTLLSRVLKEVANGTYSVPQDDDLTLDRVKRRQMDKLVATMASRLLDPRH